MGFWALVILGIVQGVTEFLPVSSSGHLVLLSKIFGIEDSLFVSIVLHVATLLSVVIVLRKELLQIVKKPFGSLGRKLIVATLPTCLIVLVLYPIVSKSFEGSALPFCFMVTAVLLLLTEFFQKKSFYYSQNYGKSINYKQALIMGIGQGLATFPGVSRSGTTICFGIFAGAKKEDVAKFSFLMSIPIIILSMALEIYKLASSGATISVNIPGLILAFFFAFVIGLISLKGMIKLTEKLNFKWFALYLIALSIIALFV